MAIAYSMGQIIKSVCVRQCICPSVGTLTVAFLDRFLPNLEDVRTPKSKNKLGANIAPPLPLFCPQNPHFRPRGPETHANIK